MKPIPWWEPLIGEAERELVVEVLAGGFVNDGEVTTAFENRVAELVGCGYAVGVANGTCALFCALAALGVGPGDEVVVPDATFIASANAVSMTGAVPVLVDVDPVRLTMSPDALMAAVTPRTKAIMPVHVSGRAADMVEIVRIAREHGLFVVEDAAEAFMSRTDGRYLGTIGDLGCFSFSPLKLITTGQGGMVVTDDAALHQRLRELKDQGRPRRSSGVDTVIPAVGYNFKLTNLQAALGIGQLGTIEWRVEHMGRVYRAYAEGLSGQNGITLPGFRVDDGEIPIWVDALVEDREDLNAFLKERHIDCRPFWNPIHTRPSYEASALRFPHASGSLPRAIWLPSAFVLTEGDIGRVCDAIRAFYRNA